MTSRRRFLAFMPALAASLNRSLLAQGRFFSRKSRRTAPAAQPLVYFGCDTDKGAKGIYAARFDPSKGQLSQLVLAAESFRPSYLAMAQQGGARLIYAANEGDAQTSRVTAYRIDPASGRLQQVSQVPAGSAGPCYISLAPSGRAAFTADYAGSSVSIFRVDTAGMLSAPAQVIHFKDPAFGHHGPNVDRQDASHPHCATLSPDGRFLLVCDLGNDIIAVFPIDAADAHLGTPHLITARKAGSGPRHVAFHPNGRWVYGVDELSNQINQYLWNTIHANGQEQALLTDGGHTVSTLDPSFSGKNTAAEIAVAPNGYYVYVSNRGDDSLVVFAVDQNNGKLTPIQRIPCGGRTPRHFTLDPTGGWLLCGNQDSASVTVFARDRASGKLTGPVQTVALESPMFTLFA